jgi:integrase
MRGTLVHRGKSWSVVVELSRDPATGKRRRKWHSGFDTKREAAAALAKLITNVNEQTYVQPSKVTLAEYFADWLPAASIDLKPATADAYRRIFARYIAEPLGGVHLQAISPTRLNTLYAELLRSGGQRGKGVSANTVRHAHVLVHRVLGSALKAGLVQRNVAAVAEPPKQQRPADLGIWSSEQLGSFVRATSTHRLAALWRLYAVTGCRRGEALAAKWDDLDLATAHYEIRRSFGVVNGSPVLGEPKTVTGRRSVALDPATVAALRAHRKEQIAERLKAGEDWNDGGWVFTQTDGSPLHPNVITRTFERLVTKAELPSIRLHDVRHSAVTALLRAGVPVKVVSERVGHASTSFTMDRYASVLPDMQSDAAGRIADAIDGPSKT